MSSTQQRVGICLVCLSIFLSTTELFAQGFTPKAFGSISPMLVYPTINTDELKAIGFDADFDTGIGIDIAGGILFSPHLGLQVEFQFIDNTDADDIVYYYSIPINTRVEGSGYLITLGPTIFGRMFIFDNIPSRYGNTNDNISTTMIVPFLSLGTGIIGIKMKAEGGYDGISYSNTEREKSIAVKLTQGITLQNSDGSIKVILAIDYVRGTGDLDEISYFALKAGLAF